MFPMSGICCRKMLKLCGETQDKLAQELIMFELTIERDVIEPLNDLSEVGQSSGTCLVTDRQKETKVITQIYVTILYGRHTMKNKKVLKTFSLRWRYRTSRNKGNI